MRWVVAERIEHIKAMEENASSGQCWIRFPIKNFCTYVVSIRFFINQGKWESEGPSLGHQN
jgi:hypothetical protein